MKPRTLYARGFTLVELLVVIAIIAALAGIGIPVILKQRKKSDVTTAISNSKQIGIALMNFDEEYGSYPSTATAQSVRDKTNTDINLGSSSSNDYLRQLIAGNYADSEKIFYAKTTYTKKPDEQKKGSKCLDNGECGFGYIMATTSEALSSSGNSGRPILVCPLLNASSNGTFDLDQYDQKAVIFRIDNSANAETVRSSDKQVTVGGGKTLFQTGDDTVWGTDITPVIRPPLKAGG